jgi:preprotein translocase subunit SecD
MVFWTRRFNLYLALIAVLGLFSGCHSFGHKEPDAALRVHIQTNPDGLDTSQSTSQTVSVLRSDPVAVTIARNPVLTEANIVAATVKDTPGGFAIVIQFDENGTWTLEQFSAANPGGHFAIFGQWGGKLINGRWLAAPLITHRIADGVLSFTPDATRAEADQLVLGLTHVAHENKKGLPK